MATTALLVEILVEGMLCFICIFLVVFRLDIVTLQMIKKILVILNEWTTLSTVLLIGVIYQFGTLGVCPPFRSFRFRRGDKAG